MIDKNIRPWQVTNKFLSFSVKILLCIFRLQAEVIISDNGCPYSFDVGTLGYEYLKPPICTTFLPSYFNESVKLNTSPMNVTLQLELTLVPGFSDTYKLLLRTTNHSKFRLWDVILQVVEIVPIIPWYITPKKRDWLGVGFFERNEVFKPYCCGNTTSRNMVRFVNPKGKRPSSIFVRWVPLKFVGNVIFLANAFNSPTEYVLNVTSPMYSVPFAMGNATEAYDEDWPEGSPFIPEE